MVLDDGEGAVTTIRVQAGQLEIAIASGAGRLRSHGRTASLTVRNEVPEALAAAVVGRPVDLLVSHPLLDGAGLTVERATLRAGRTRLLLSAGRRPWRAPWTRGGACGGAADGARAGRGG